MSRIESFAIEGGSLVRRVVPATTKVPYQHKCPLDSFREVTFAIDELHHKGCPVFTIGRIRQHTGLPDTQVAVSLAFLLDRGCIVTARGRGPHGAGSRIADGNRDHVHADAMTELMALREFGPSAPPFNYPLIEEAN